MSTIATPLSAVKTILDLSLLSSLIACSSALLILNLGVGNLLGPYLNWPYDPLYLVYLTLDTLAMMYSKCGQCLEALAELGPLANKDL